MPLYNTDFGGRKSTDDYWILQFYCNADKKDDDLT